MEDGTKKIYDLLIVGAGPAGLTAAIYARRSNLDVAYFEKEVPGGKLTKTALVENYPGVEQIGGADLALRMMKQANDLKVPQIFGEVTKISFDTNHVFTLELANQKTYRSHTVIVATGMKERMVGAINEEKFYGKGVSYCAICDGALYKNRPVAVIGGGNSAMEEGLYLAGIASKVYLIHRRDVFRANPTLTAKMLHHPRVETYLWHTLERVDSIGNSVEAMQIKNQKTGSVKELKVDCVFPYVGLDPISSFVANLGILDELGYAEVNQKMETKIRGLYVAGDVNRKELRQITTAVSDGAIAATSAKTYLDAAK